ncbi:MAG: gliding motility-associated C-terminal domain-containing protein [Cytophagaceae bacterium]
MHYSISFILIFLCSVFSFGQSVSRTESGFPEVFISNQGQISDQRKEPGNEILFYTQIQHTSYYFCNDRIIVQHFKNSKPISESGNKEGEQPVEISKMELVFEGTSETKIVRPGSTNVYKENFYLDHGVFTGVSSFDDFFINDIYPLIDFHFYFENGKVKYDILIHPGGDISKVKFNCRDNQGEKANGSVIEFYNSHGSLQHNIPYSYMEKSKKPVPVSFTDTGSGYGFKCSTNTNETIVIDPLLDWVTNYSGTMGSSPFNNNSCSFLDTDIDNNGNTISVGNSTFSDRMVTSGSFQTTYAGNGDGVIVKFNSAGQRIYGTYVGGNQGDGLFSIITIENDIYVGGYSFGGNHLIKGNIHQQISFFPKPGEPSTNQNRDGLLMKFRENGTLVWGTFYGSKWAWETITDITHDGTGNIYVTGEEGGLLTGSPPPQGDTIATSGTFIHNKPGDTDAFIVKFDTSGTRIWGTFFGTDVYEKLNGITYGNNAIYVVGEAYKAEGLVTEGTHMTSIQRGAIFQIEGEAILAKISNEGQLIWGTLYGGKEIERGYGVGVDNDGNIIIGGMTYSDNLETTADGYQKTPGNYHDAFIAKFNDCGQLLIGSYYGGESSDDIHDLVTDSKGYFYVTGRSYSTNSFASSDAAVPENNGGSDAFVSVFDKNFNRHYSTYIGGTNIEEGHSISFKNGVVAIAGITRSPEGIGSSSGHQQNYSGQLEDGFTARLSDVVYPEIPPVVDPSDINIIEVKPGNTICKGTKVSLTSDITGNWYINNTNQNISSTVFNTESLNNGDKVRVHIFSGCTIKSDEIQFTVLNPDLSTGLQDTVIVCDLTSHVLSISNPAITSFAWSTESNTSSTTVHSTDTYKVTVSNGTCSAIDSSYVRFSTSPSLELGEDKVICGIRYVDIESNIEADKYLWSTGNIGPSIRVLLGGNYVLTVTKDGCSSTDDINIKYVQIYENLEDTLIRCRTTESVTLNAGNAGAEFLWNTGANTQSINATTTGLFKVQVSKDGCTLHDSTFVWFVSPPDIKLSDTIICKHSSLNVNIGTHPGYTIKWFKDPDPRHFNTSNQIVLTDHGKYRLEMEGEHCNTSQEFMLQVRELPLIALPEKTYFCDETEGSVNLDAGNSGVKYTWSNGNTSALINVNTAGIYTVTVEDEAGCTSDALTEVINQCRPLLFIPKAFTPNNDGLNEEFKIIARFIDSFEMTILNKWGEVIFHTTDTNTFWDGNYMGQPVPSGAYAFVLNFTGTYQGNEVEQKIAGDITLIR